MPFNSNYIIINFTFINMLLRWLQQQELTSEHTTWWLMKIVLERGFLKLKSNMYILLGFLWHNNGMEFVISIFWKFLKFW
jgi:hypothetical protein